MIRDRTGLSLFEWLVNLSTITALVLQCINLPDSWNKYVQYIAYLVIFFFIISIILTILNRRKTSYKRPALVERTKQDMINSRGTVVMFGGDLSWAEDYIDTIAQIANNSQLVEIIFPLEKILHAPHTAIQQFDNRVQWLKQAGAKIYSTEEDYHLRCTLIDIQSDDMCVVSSKRISKDPKNPNNNKYQVNILQYSNPKERALCNSFYLSYCWIKKHCTQY